MAHPYCLRPLTGALLGLVLSLFALSSGAVADPPAATYSFTILEVPDTTETRPTSINDSGQVAGNYIDSSGDRGFVYSNGTFTTLDVPGATSTSATSINDSGQVAGYYQDGSGTHGFVYSNGTFTTLDVPGATSTSASSINDSGQVAGYYQDGSGTHGFVYSNGAFTTLDVPGAYSTSARSINDSGQVAGSYDGTRHGFIYSNGTFTILDIPNIGFLYEQEENVLSINDSGQVAGDISSYSTGKWGMGVYGFVYSNGTFIRLDVPGAYSTYATSINNRGQVAGYYQDGYTHGFVYSNGTFTTLDPPRATWTEAVSINDSGQVAGSYSDGSGTYYGFIATPMVTDIPTLSQWALLLGGGLLIGMALLAQVRRTRPLRG